MSTMQSDFFCPSARKGKLNSKEILETNLETLIKEDNEEHLISIAQNLALSSIHENNSALNPSEQFTGLISGYQDLLEYLLNQHKALSDHTKQGEEDLNILSAYREDKDAIMLQNKDKIEELRKLRNDKKEDLKSIKHIITNAENLKRKADALKPKFFFCNVCQNRRFTNVIDLDNHTYKYHNNTKSLLTSKSYIKDERFSSPNNLNKTLFLSQGSMEMKQPQLNSHEVKQLQSDCAELLKELKQQQNNNFNEYAKKLVEDQINQTKDLLKDITATHDVKVNNLINELDQFKKTVAINLQEIAELNKENTPILNLLHKKRQSDLRFQAKTNIPEIPDFTLMSDRGGIRHSSEIKKNPIRLTLKEENKGKRGNEERVIDVNKFTVIEPESSDKVKNKKSIFKPKEQQDKTKLSVVPDNIHTFTVEPVKITRVELKPETSKTDEKSKIESEKPQIEEKPVHKLLDFKTNIPEKEKEKEKENSLKSAEESKENAKKIELLKKELQAEEPKEGLKDVSGIFTVRGNDVPDYSFSHEKQPLLSGSEDNEIFKKIPIKIDDTDKRKNIVVSQAVDYTPMLDIFNRFLSRDNNFIEFGNLNKYKTILEQAPPMNKAKIEENLTHLSNTIFERFFKDLSTQDSAVLKKKLLDNYEGLLNRQTYFQIYDSNIFNLLSFNQLIYFTTNNHVREMKRGGTAKFI
jgi:hypothetical protein